MKALNNTLLVNISGGSFRSAANMMGASLTGAAIGAFMGANLLDPALIYFNIQSQSYVGQMKATMLNFYISNKYGQFGLDSKNDVIGTIGGAFIGSILGPIIFAGLAY